MKTVIAELAAAPGPDELSEAAVAQRATNVLRPLGSFERLDRVAAWLAGWQGTDLPEVERPGLLLAAADHGVVARGVSAYPPEVTTAMIDAIRAGAATSTVLAGHLGASMRLLDVGVGAATGDITSEDAMTTDRFLAAFAEGREAVSTMDVDLLLLGEMGIGNTTTAAAVSMALFGGAAEDWVGPGSGIEEERRADKADVVRRAVERVGPADPFEVLRRLGGLELAAIAGAVVEARMRSLPVLLVGFVTTAAVAPIEVAMPGALDHTYAAHVSSEPGHRLLLERLGKAPLLDLELRLGEGSGALLALPIVRAAAVAVTDVATFEEWGLR